MNSITKADKEQLIRDMLAIQREELNLTIAQFKASGMNRARLRQAEREQWQKMQAETRRLVELWYPSPASI